MHWTLQTLILGATSGLALACTSGDAGESAGSGTGTSTGTATAGETGDTDSTGATDPTDPTATSGPTDPTGETDPTTDGAPACGSFNVTEIEGPTDNYASLSALDTATFDGSCYSGSGQETFFAFVSSGGTPVSFLVTQAEFTPRMVVFGGEAGCEPELACVADVTPANAVYRTLAPGEIVRVGVDAAGPGQFGEFKLETYPGLLVSCLAYAELIDSDVPLPNGAVGDLSDPDVWQDTSFGSCGGMNHRDFRYVWVPTVGGKFRFTLTPNGFDGVLYVAPDVLSEESLSCTEELACANEAGLSGAESVTLDLQADEWVRIFVDGQPGVGTPGAFDLTIEQL